MPTHTNELTILSTAHKLTQALLQPIFFASFPPLSTNHTKPHLKLSAIFTISLKCSDSSPVPYIDDVLDEDTVISHLITPIKDDIVDSTNPPSSEIVVTNEGPRMSDPPSHNDFLLRATSPNAFTNIHPISFIPPPPSLPPSLPSSYLY